MSFFDVCIHRSGTNEEQDKQARENKNSPLSNIFLFCMGAGGGTFLYRGYTGL